jgi:hypothetical protein
MNDVLNEDRKITRRMEATRKESRICRVLAAQGQCQSGSIQSGPLSAQYNPLNTAFIQLLRAVIFRRASLTLFPIRALPLVFAIPKSLLIGQCCHCMHRGALPVVFAALKNLLLGQFCHCMHSCALPVVSVTSNSFIVTCMAVCSYIVAETVLKMKEKKKTK